MNLQSLALEIDRQAALAADGLVERLILKMGRQHIRQACSEIGRTHRAICSCDFCCAQANYTWSRIEEHRAKRDYEITEEWQLAASADLAKRYQEAQLAAARALSVKSSTAQDFITKK